MTTLYRRLYQKKIKFSHICEVGVYEPETSNILDFIKSGIRTTLVEANPDLARRIEYYFKDYSVWVYPVAVWDYAGKLLLAKAKASTFAIALDSTPALRNDYYKIDENNTFEVECVVFSSIDDGTIDLISIDVEGSEWYVLKHMLSRPNIISIETHGKNYTNPFINNIDEWMRQNNYRIWLKDNSDSVYVKEGTLAVTQLDRFRLTHKNFRINLRRQKGRFLQYLGLR